MQNIEGEKEEVRTSTSGESHADNQQVGTDNKGQINKSDIENECNKCSLSIFRQHYYYSYFCTYCHSQSPT